MKKTTVNRRRWAAGAVAGLAAAATFGLAAPSAQAACTEDGLALLNDAGLGLDDTWVLLSGGIHRGTEGDWTSGVVDPITVPLLGLSTTALVHEVNCGAVEPLEDVIDEITVPLVNQLGLPGLFQSLGL